jgi:hypothetical protein
MANWIHSQLPLKSAEITACARALDFTYLLLLKDYRRNDDGGGESSSSSARNPK